MRKTEQERFWAKVNKTEWCWIWTAAKREGYGVFSLTVDDKGHRKMSQAHRYAFSQANGEIPPGFVLDHICHNPSCVRPEHLRVATQKENLEHRIGPNKGNPSGALGVQLNGKKWAAGVRHNGEYIPAGTYETIREADFAARKLRLKLYTHNESDRTRVVELAKEVQDVRKAHIWECVAQLEALIAA